MKKTLIILLLKIGLVSSLCISMSYAGGPWAAGKKKGYMQLSYSHLSYRKLFNLGEEKTPLKRRVLDQTLQLYMEAGISNRWTATASFPWKTLSTSQDTLAASAFTQTLPSGKMVGLGNPSLSGKYTFVQKKVVAAANGLGLAEGGAFKVQMFCLVPMLIEVRMFKFSTSAPILAIENQRS